MRAEIPHPTTVDIHTILVDIPIRYEDDYEDMREREVPFIFERWDPNNYPRLRFAIDVDGGRITGWHNQHRFFVHTKPCDEGLYTVVGDGFKPKTMMDGEWYVPACIPSSYGDYLVFSADEDGYLYTDLEYTERWVADADEIVADFWREQ